MGAVMENGMLGNLIFHNSGKIEISRPVNIEKCDMTLAVA